jgi:hypothetical protein
MSEVILFGIHADGNITEYDRVNNAWRGCIAVWEHLRKKYQIKEDDSLFSINYKNTWNAFGTGKYKRYEDIVIGTTFDHALVYKEHFAELINAYQHYRKTDKQNNLNQQLQIIKTMQKDPDIIGVAWNQNSIVDDQWTRYDEDRDIKIPYNIFKQHIEWPFNHFEVFTELKKQYNKH